MLRVLLVLKGVLALKVVKEHRGYRDLRVLLVLKVGRVLSGHKVKLDHKDYRELKEA